MKKNNKLSLILLIVFSFHKFQTDTEVLIGGKLLKKNSYFIVLLAVFFLILKILEVCQFKAKIGIVLSV